MKRTTKIVSILMATLLLVGLLPLPVFAASLKITTQPKTSYTAYGSTAKATVKATGDGLKYTWYIKNAGSSKYSKSSITKATYSATMNDKASGRSVYCVVKDKKGKSVKSKTAILRMKATITTEPKNTYVKKGATAKLTLKAKGDGLKYTWYIKNAGASKYSKSSVTKSSYSTTMNEKSNGRYMYCVVTDKYGKTDKSKTVVLRQAATIVTQPVDAEVEEGVTAKVTVQAEGDGLTYAWYIKNAGGSKFSKSSITKNTYSVKMSASSNGRQVYCVVTDKYGKTDQSETVTLKQKGAPLTITMQPEDVTCKVGDIATFTVQVAGGKAPYTYQWQCYCEGDGDFWWDIEADMEWAGGYNTPSLGIEVSPADFVDVTKYRCVITDAAGNQVISNEVEVIEAESPLTITYQPEDATAAVGNQVGFGVMAEGGKAPYTYQWQCTYLGSDGWQDFYGETINEGALHSLLVLVSQQEFDDQYRYRCVITDAAGNQVITNEVKVIQAFDELAFNVPPQTVTASVGDEVSFYPIVEGGKAPYTYQWQIKGALGTEYVDLEEGQYQGVTEDYFHFIVNDFEFDNGHTYRVIVTDALGNQLISDPVWVEKAEDPLTIDTQPQNATAKVGDTVSFTVGVFGGTTPYTYRWQYKSNDFDWNDIIGWADGNDATLSFQVPADEFEYGYQYRCIVTDANGTQLISDPVWVEQAKEPLALLIDPVDVYAKVGDTVSFTVGVAGGTGPYTYRWEYMAHNFSWTDVAGWTNGTDATLSFVVASNEFTSGYQYRCIITDADGETLTTNAVMVKPKMSIVTQPKGGFAAVGEEISAFVEVDGGKGPYTYQWQYWNGSKWLNMTGETYSRLSLTMDQGIIANAYHYRCVITDATDTMLFTEDVQFKETMRIWIQPANTIKEIGSIATFQVAVTGGAEPYRYQWQIHTVGNGDVWSDVPLGAAWASGQQTEMLSFVVGQYEYGKYQYRCIITDAAGNQLISNAAWVIEY